jgi:hypothetical protein
MKKNDKVVVTLGVIILLIASVFIYYWVPDEAGVGDADINEFFGITGVMKKEIDTITVADDNPFFALIATPLAISYSEDAQQTLRPLYVQNAKDPSDAILRLKGQINHRTHHEFIRTDESSTDASVRIAETYWESAEAAVLIEDNLEGYSLGVLLIPIASYLRIPVMVCEEMNQEVSNVLLKLGVEKTIVCGSKDFEGYGDALVIDTAEEAADFSVEILHNKFPEQEIDYMTITNPIDAFPPKVVHSQKKQSFTKTIPSGSSTMIVNAVTKAMANVEIGRFTIPDNYTYARVKFTGVNLDSEHVETLGDNVNFKIGANLEDINPALQGLELYAGGTNAGGVPVRDSTGKIIEDKTYTETVLYDRGGVEYVITAKGAWMAAKDGEVRADVIVEKLEHPYYEPMKGLSSIAPYLTAYHQGFIFGKTDFAFAATDDVLTDEGEPSPGYWMPRRNLGLVDAFNDHVWGIHDQINLVLADLAGIELKEEYDLKSLQKYYEANPIHVALVGGGTAIPQFLYDNGIEPTDEDHVGYWGIGLPTDFIYGNIDPIREYHGNIPDKYGQEIAGDMYPVQENIVGRITGWDVEEANALVLRSLFYNEIIDDLGDWKETAILQMGGGNDFQKPFVKYKLFAEILGITNPGEPLKMWTGASELNGLTIEKQVKELGFDDVDIYRENEAILEGFGNEAIDKLKNANLLNKLLLSPRQIRNELGEDVCNGKEQQEGANFIMANAHGNQHYMVMGDVGVYKLGLGLPNGILQAIFGRFAAPILHLGPGQSLGDLGSYSTRTVSGMDMGPSFLWMESCIVGEFGGLHPTQGLHQAYIHAGCAAVVASGTCTNIAGGYIDPKPRHYDLPGETLLRYIKAKNALEKQGQYPDLHFGFKLYTDTLDYLNNNEGATMGEAFRSARNMYFKDGEAEWRCWWSPPLGFTTGDDEYDQEMSYKHTSDQPNGLLPRMDNKYLTFYEYTLHGDPGFVPYVPSWY